VEAKRLTALTTKLPSKTSTVETEVDRAIALELVIRRCICLENGLAATSILAIKPLDHITKATRASCSARMQ
jgi:hypothetical protein